MCISTFFYHSNIQCVPIIKSHAKYSLYVRSRLCACAHARKCVCVCMHAWRKRETYTHYDWNARNALVFESTGSHTHAAPAVLPAVTSGAACPTAEGHFRLNRTALAGEGGGEAKSQEPGPFCGNRLMFLSPSPNLLPYLFTCRKSRSSVYIWRLFMYVDRRIVFESEKLLARNVTDV